MYTVRFAYALAVMACLNGGGFWARFVMTALGLDDLRDHCESSTMDLNNGGVIPARGEIVSF